MSASRSRSLGSSERKPVGARFRPVERLRTVVESQGSSIALVAPTAAANSAALFGWLDAHGARFGPVELRSSCCGDGIGGFLTEAQLPQQLARAIGGVTENKYLILMMLNVAFLILGMFLHSAAAIILVVPIVMPMVLAAGIDPVHFGLVVTLNLAIGQQTPPVASVLIAACSIAKSDIWETTKVNLPFIGALLALLLISTYLPAISLLPVRLIYGG